MNRKEIWFIFRKEVVQMDALVEGLMEELNCETVFTIPLFGGIPVYESVVVTWIIMAVVFLLCILLSRNLSVENPSRRQVVVETAIKGLNDFFTETVGEKGKAYCRTGHPDRPRRHDVPRCRRRARHGHLLRLRLR